MYLSVTADPPTLFPDSSHQQSLCSYLIPAPLYLTKGVGKEAWKLAECIRRVQWGPRWPREYIGNMSQSPNVYS